MIAHWKQSGLVVALLVAFPWVASAQQGMPSKATLEAMGLSSIQVMSDQEALAVRGQGFVLSGGLSWAYIGTPAPLPPAASINLNISYGDYFATSSNSSYADRLVVDGQVVAVPPALPLAADVDIRYVRVRAGGTAAGAAF